MPSERDENGRFTKGNPGGPGRPPREVEADYLTTMMNVVTMDDWQAIVARAVDDAKGGCAKARDWISRHLIGDRQLVQPIAAASTQQDIQIQWVDDWYGTSSESADAVGASAERAEQLRAFQDANMLPTMRENNDQFDSDD
jgi:hypothetical protein